jgi:4'-phosphopantetheinyl transferase
LTLDPGEIHVWWASVENHASDRETLEAVLDENDRNRVNRIRVENARLQNLLAHGAVRILLADYTGLDAGAITFSFADRGRPFLAPVPGIPPVDFNLSHSGDNVVFAFSRGSAVGIDIEADRPAPSAQKLARRFFSEPEHTYIESLPKSAQARAFYHCWTCKEALLKATGEGLAKGGLRQVEVQPDPDVSPRVVRIAQSRTAAEAWFLHRVALPAPAMCTVATRTAGQTIRILSLADRI